MMIGVAVLSVIMMLPLRSAWNNPLFRVNRCLTLKRSRYHSSVVCQLNRFLFHASEVDHASKTVTLPRDDYRTVHAAKVLSLHNGDTIRSGVVSCESHDGLVTNKATIQWIPEGKVKKAEPLGNGKPPGSLRIHLASLKPSEQRIAKPSVSLILALPRPLQLGRMLPMISQMGIDTLVLTAACKVPKDYFGSHLFRKPELLTARLIEGLCQAGDVRLPKVHIVRNLSNFLNNGQMDDLFPRSAYVRAIAHPQRTSDGEKNSALRMRDLQFPTTDAASNSSRRLVVAVGPEGGWDEPNELELFREHGFQQITMGSRILRSDCAVVSLLGLAHDACIDE